MVFTIFGALLCRWPMILKFVLKAAYDPENCTVNKPRHLYTGENRPVTEMESRNRHSDSRCAECTGTDKI